MVTAHDREGNIIERIFLLSRVSVAQVLQFDLVSFFEKILERFRLSDQGSARLWGIQYTVDLLRSGHAGNTGVVTRAQVAQWKVKIGCNEKYKESLLKGDAPIQQPQTDLHGYHSSRKGRNQFQRQSCKKSDP